MSVVITFTDDNSRKSSRKVRKKISFFSGTLILKQERLSGVDFWWRRISESCSQLQQKGEESDNPPQPVFAKLFFEKKLNPHFGGCCFCWGWFLLLLFCWLISYNPLFKVNVNKVGRHAAQKFAFLSFWSDARVFVIGPRRDTSKKHFLQSLSTQTIPVPMTS